MVERRVGIVINLKFGDSRVEELSNVIPVEWLKLNEMGTLDVLNI
jgi:hypothetical protein